MNSKIHNNFVQKNLKPDNWLHLLLYKVSLGIVLETKFNSQQISGVISGFFLLL